MVLAVGVIWFGFSGSWLLVALGRFRVASVRLDCGIRRAVSGAFVWFRWGSLLGRGFVGFGVGRVVGGVQPWERMGALRLASYWISRMSCLAFWVSARTEEAAALNLSAVGLGWPGALSRIIVAFTRWISKLIFVRSGLLSGWSIWQFLYLHRVSSSVASSAASGETPPFVSRPNAMKVYLERSMVLYAILLCLALRPCSWAASPAIPFRMLSRWVAQVGSTTKTSMSAVFPSIQFSMWVNS